MNLKNLLLAISFLITLDSASAQTCFNGYFKPNSTFDLNRRSLLSSISSNVRTHNGFYSTSIGQGSNRIFIIGMCIPGTKPDECSKCIQGGSDGLLGRCPNQTVGYVWPECCMVRYSNISFSESLVMEPSRAVSNPQAINVNLTLFDRIWGELMSRTITVATSTNVSSSLDHKYYAAEVASLNDIQTIYAMMECMPDVSSGSCKYCLKQTVVDYKKCCHGHKAGAFIRPFCYIRWGLIPFAGAFENVTSPPPPPELLPQPPPQFLPQLPLSLTPSRPKDAKTISTGIILAIFVPIVVILVLLVVGFVVWRRRISCQTVEAQAGDQVTKTYSVQFGFKTIEAATDKFSERNMIGQGGFGEVYRGTLSNGTEVAVKRLSKHQDKAHKSSRKRLFL